MGFSQETCTDSTDIFNTQTIPYATVSLLSSHYCHHNNYHKFRTFFKKMIWEFGFSCVGGNPSSSSSSKRNMSCLNDENSHKTTKSFEHSKAWLLAESGPELNNADPQSVHSSFRFSFCSQVELDSLNMSSSTAATVLMVNLDNGVFESRSRELKLRRMESLEKTISPVTHSLIRFRFADILSATRNFSKGNIFLGLSFCFSLKQRWLMVIDDSFV